MAPSSLQRQGIIYAWRLLGVRAGWDPLWPLKNMGYRGVPAPDRKVVGRHDTLADKSLMRRARAA